VAHIGKMKNSYKNLAQKEKIVTLET
jgi:hypothetical protein